MNKPKGAISILTNGSERSSQSRDPTEQPTEAHYFNLPNEESKSHYALGTQSSSLAFANRPGHLLTFSGEERPDTCDHRNIACKLSQECVMQRSSLNPYYPIGDSTGSVSPNPPKKSFKAPNFETIKPSKIRFSFNQPQTITVSSRPNS